MSTDPHTAPGLPEIHDEAADTPIWVPLLGLALLILAALYMVVSAALGDAEEQVIEAPALQAPAAEQDSLQ